MARVSKHARPLGEKAAEIQAKASALEREWSEQPRAPQWNAATDLEKAIADVAALMDSEGKGGRGGGEEAVREELKIVVFDSDLRDVRGDAEVPLSHKVLVRKCEQLLGMAEAVREIRGEKEMDAVVESVVGSRDVLVLGIGDADAAKIGRGLRECENVIMGRSGDIISGKCLQEFKRAIEDRRKEPERVEKT